MQFVSAGIHTTFFSPELVGAIPGNFDVHSDTFGIELYATRFTTGDTEGDEVLSGGEAAVSLSAQIPPTAGDWVVDTARGTVQFLDHGALDDENRGYKYIVNDENPPRISFFKYIGSIGAGEVDVSDKADVAAVDSLRGDVASFIDGIADELTTSKVTTAELTMIDDAGAVDLDAAELRVLDGAGPMVVAEGKAAIYGSLSSDGRYNFGPGALEASWIYLSGTSPNNVVMAPNGAIVTGAGRFREVTVTDCNHGAQVTPKSYVDGEVSALEQALEHRKADKTAVAALTERVNSKADNTAVSLIGGEVAALGAHVDTKADGAAVSSLGGEVAALGAHVDTKADGAAVSSLRGDVASLRGDVASFIDGIADKLTTTELSVTGDTTIAGALETGNTTIAGTLRTTGEARLDSLTRLQNVHITGAFSYNPSAADNATFYKQPILQGTVTNPEHAAHKAYVDSAVDSATSSGADFGRFPHEPDDSGVHLRVVGQYRDDNEDRITIPAFDPSDRESELLLKLDGHDAVRAGPLMLDQLYYGDSRALFTDPLGEAFTDMITFLGNGTPIHYDSGGGTPPDSVGSTTAVLYAGYHGDESAYLYLFDTRAKAIDTYETTYGPGGLERVALDMQTGTSFYESNHTLTGPGPVGLRLTPNTYTFSEFKTMLVDTLNLNMDEPYMFSESHGQWMLYGPNQHSPPTDFDGMTLRLSRTGHGDNENYGFKIAARGVVALALGLPDTPRDVTATVFEANYSDQWTGSIYRGSRVTGQAGHEHDFAPMIPIVTASDSAVRFNKNTSVAGDVFLNGSAEYPLGDTTIYGDTHIHGKLIADNLDYTRALEAMGGVTTGNYGLDLDRSFRFLFQFMETQFADDLSGEMEHVQLFGSPFNPTPKYKSVDNGYGPILRSGSLPDLQRLDSDTNPPVMSELVAFITGPGPGNHGGGMLLAYSTHTASDTMMFVISETFDSADTTVVWPNTDLRYFVPFRGYINFGGDQWFPHIKNYKKKLLSIGGRSDDALRLYVDDQLVLNTVYHDKNSVSGTGNDGRFVVHEVVGNLVTLNGLFFCGGGGNHFSLYVRVLAAYD